MLIKCLRDVWLMIVYRRQMLMFFLHVIDLLLRPMFREICIQHILDECGGMHLDKIREHERGCFQLPCVVI